ncbi:MAG TPA: hypothetical protein VEV62_19555 [Parafilimonas sp.]|nr:hypothetical protein [Parafilimonas sp.]
MAVVEDLENYKNGLVNLINWAEGYECTGAYATDKEAIKNRKLCKQVF